MGLSRLALPRRATRESRRASCSAQTPPIGTETTSIRQRANVDEEKERARKDETRRRLSHLFDLLSFLSSKQQRQVEEISAAESHKKAAADKADPLEEFCKDSPDAVRSFFFF